MNSAVATEDRMGLVSTGAGVAGVYKPSMLSLGTELGFSEKHGTCS